jgi:NodT family efflux transporter outer membrane factor (OMF) lipoprotein
MKTACLEATMKIGSGPAPLPAPRIALLLCASLASGCITVGPDYETPETKVPDKWQQAIVEEMKSGEPDIMRWWESFGDPQLTGYMERAREGNPGLQEAVARLREARAIRAIAAGERMPDINGLGAAERTRTSEDFFPPTGDRTDNIYDYGVNARWEADVWGRVRRLVESADANLQASLESYRDVLVLLYAQVALAYTDVRTSQERINYIRGNIKTQRDALGLVQDRNKAGLASDLEVRQAELNLYRTEAFLPTLQARLTAAINQLGVLLGEPPSALHGELAERKQVPKARGDFNVGAPGDLVRRRPDIRAAERALAAQTARIGVATAELYPRFNINGNFSILTSNFDDGADWDNRNWAFGGFFTWNLFDGGRIRGLIEVEDARTEQALERYEQTVLEALEDVETSISDYAREQQRRDSLSKSVFAAEESVRLVLILYRTGLTDFQNVLDMQRSLFEQQDQYADSDGIVTVNLIRIYTALGGGWDPADLPEME